MIRLAFLDRATLAKNVKIRPLQVPHEWVFFERTAEEQIAERCAEADAVITNKVPITRELLDQLPQLKYVGVAATGVNVVDLDACRDKGITVTNVAGYSTDSVAEHTLMLMLMLLRQSLPYQHALMDGQWQAQGQFCFFLEPIRSLRGLQLGLVGTGVIARRVAELARAFGMTVHFFSPSGRRDVDGQSTVSWSDLLRDSDVLSLHCPLTEKTENLINVEALGQLKPTAVLINTARGPVVDGSALLSALENGQLAGAALDVLPVEPPAESDAVYQAARAMGRLIVTPHIAWTSETAMQRLADQLVYNLDRFFSGKPVSNLAR